MNGNVLILSGSPRKNGATDKLVSAFIEGAESAGNKVTLFRTADMKINGCLGCRNCSDNPGSCVQNDDMAEIIKVFAVSDAIVFASPVYFFTVSAQIKAAIDRTYTFRGGNTSIKRSALLLSCGDSSGEAAEGAIVTYENMLKYRKWENAGVVVVPGLSGVNLIDGCAELEAARELGQNIL